jgi:proline iminopeptidase
MRALVIVAAAFATAVLVAPARADDPPPRPTSRAEAVDVVRKLRRIVTPDGIERAEKVRIGGIDQWVTIRGKDRHNPVLLVLHGGPGYVEGPLAWWYATGWEEYFTVVQWDQRGAGKTYLINDPKAIAFTMTRERMVQDAEELTAWLRKDLGKSKIFVWGHSWGSYLGLELARRHPDWLHAYIGTGQATNSLESERRGYAYALAQAKQTGHAQAVAELEAIAPYPSVGKPTPLQSIATTHRWGDYFGGVMAYRHDQDDESHAGRLSPDYTDAEAPHVFDGNNFSEEYLLADVMTMDLSTWTTFRVPLILLEGRHDRTVNSDVAYQWFNKVKAPEKHFVWFEHSAHEPESEEPGKFLVSLVRYARPIAARAGDGAP